MRATAAAAAAAAAAASSRVGKLEEEDLGDERILVLRLGPVVLQIVQVDGGAAVCGKAAAGTRYQGCCALDKPRRARAEAHRRRS